MNILNKQGLLLCLDTNNLGKDIRPVASGVAGARDSAEVYEINLCRKMTSIFKTSC